MERYRAAKAVIFNFLGTRLENFYTLLHFVLRSKSVTSQTTDSYPSRLTSEDYFLARPYKRTITPPIMCIRFLLFLVCVISCYITCVFALDLSEHHHCGNTQNYVTPPHLLFLHHLFRNRTLSLRGN